jgi:hypothetical protein
MWILRVPASVTCLHVDLNTAKLSLKESTLDKICDGETFCDNGHRNYRVTWLQMVVL